MTGPFPCANVYSVNIRVRADLNISLDGFAATADGTPENPFGEDWGRLVAAYTATRTFRSTVMGETDGSGTTGVDDDFGAAYFENIGAEIMGAGMFGLHLYGDDPDWRGWWGETPPFDYPVYVLTHRARPSIEVGSATFHFIDASPADALAMAAQAAGGRDVRIGGGPTVVTEFLRADLIDELHVAVVPIILGQGIRLWDGVRGLDRTHEVSTVLAESGVTHVTFTRHSEGRISLT